ncbi:hypothetical protein M1105_20010 [Limibaculum sp. FT325]|uniref:hypothetical protein n=1 Tax=Thermohalobaculum sediminis TaxID=2939436 RepID=UPI0020C12DD8|nr:hypothetical protein [Limibaculum sediminis]MCL5779249.1 hypothetical protein [Limibaculum sediminis]
MGKLLLSAVALAFLMVPAAAQQTGGDSVEEVARKLNDPNAALSAVQFKFRYFEYEGDLPGANDQNSFDIEFQPIMPFDPFSFSTDEVTYKMILRPAIIAKFNQPTFDASTLDWDNADFGLADIAFDFDFAASYKTGFVWAFGANGTLPSGTNSDLTAGRWGIGPELVLGHVGKSVTIASLLAHQFDVGGWKGESTDITQINPIFAYLPGGGWSLNSSSVLLYNHNTDDWTIPLNAGVFKTVMIGGIPVKLGAEFNYFVKQPDAFGPDWQVSFNITPVLANPFASWITW